MKTANLKDRVEQVVKLNGVLKLKVSANKGTSVDFIDLPKGYEVPEGPIEEINFEVPKPATPPAPAAPAKADAPAETAKTDSSSAPAGDQANSAGAPAGDAWKHTCQACDFATNDDELWAKHNKSKAHKDKIAVPGA